MNRDPRLLYRADIRKRLPRRTFCNAFDATLGEWQDSEQKNTRQAQQRQQAIGRKRTSSFRNPTHPPDFAGTRVPTLSATVNH